MQMIDVEDLSLQYGNQQVLNHISFSVSKGQIIGLLGPNGAGKSSILKVLAGLVFPNTGTLKIKDTVQKSFTSLRSHCGFLIDAPSFYPFLSAEKNLKLIQKITNSKADLNDLLKKVGLSDVGIKKVKNFSMGMKQRLAIAQALLRSPEILILDEPFNGLDPNGFQDLVLLLKELNKNGITIIISSHLLNELEQLSDGFILLHQGNIKLNISKEELLIAENKIALTFNQEINEEAKLFLAKFSSDFIEKNKVVIILSSTKIAEVVSKLVDLKCVPIEVVTKTILQEKYLEITN